MLTGRAAGPLPVRPAVHRETRAATDHPQLDHQGRSEYENYIAERSVDGVRFNAIGSPECPGTWQPAQPV